MSTPITTPSSVQLPGPESYSPGLDGVRALAVSLVIMTHANLLFSVDSAHFAEAVARLPLRLGWVGVDVFFILSGLLITGILAGTRAKSAYFRSFYARRALRILPLAYVVLGLAYAAAYVSSEPAEWTRLVSELPWLATYTSNIYSATTGVGTVGWTGHYWSLAVEEQFYFVWPLVVYWTPPPRLRTVAGAVYVGLVLTRIVVRLVIGDGLGIYLVRYDVLVLGAWLWATLRQSPHGGSARFWFVGAAAVFIGAGGTAVLLGGHDQVFPGGLFMDTLGYPLVSVMAAAGIVLAVTPSSRVHRWCVRPFARRVGRYSYAMYLVHLPITGLIGYFARGLEPAAGTWAHGVLAGASVITVWLMSFALAALLHVLVERPFLTLKSRFPADG